MGEAEKKEPVIRQWRCNGCHQILETRDGNPPKECDCENTVKIAGFQERPIKAN